MLFSWLRSFFLPRRVHRTDNRLRPRFQLLEDRLAPAAGLLDPTFGDGGKFTYDLGVNESILATTIDGSGRSVSVGRYDNSAFIVRFLPSGQPDSTFNGNGVLTFDFGGGEIARAVAIDGNGKIVVAGSSQDHFIVRRFNDNGALDTSFSSDGVAFSNFSGYAGETANAIALDGSGRIVVAGQGANTTFGDTNVLVARFLADGTLDSSFSSGGQFVYGGSNNETIRALAIDPVGNLVVAGATRSGTGPADFLILRITPSGAMDNAFSSDGFVSVDFSSGSDFASGVAIDGLGRIVVAGDTLASNSDAAFVRLNTDGSLDTSFGAGGRSVISIPASEEDISAVAIDGDGKIVAAGDSTSGSDENFFVLRLNANGTPDTTFDGDGRTGGIFGSSVDAINAMSIDSQGNILVTGRNNTDLALARYTGDGSVVLGSTQFNTSGLRTTTIASSGKAVAIDRDGKTVVASDDGTQFRITRLNADGSLDTTFGIGGSVIRDFAFGGPEFAEAIAIDGFGRIVVAGRVDLQGSSGFDLVVARFLPNGTVDGNFAGTGRQIISASGMAVDSANAVAIDASGRIVIAGRTDSNFVVVRLLDDGAYDTSFAINGAGITNVGFPAIANSMAIDASGRIVVAGTANNGISNNIVVVRYTANGFLDNSFSGDGKAFADSGSDDSALSVAIDPAGKIVVAGQSGVGGDSDFGIARFLSNGNLDTSFDGDGLQSVSFQNTGTEIAQRVLIDGFGKILIVGSVLPLVDSTRDVQIARLNDNGSLDGSFGEGGRITISSVNSQANDAAIDARGRIVLTGVVNGNLAIGRYDPTMAPVGVILDDTPTFTWPAIPEAIRYDIAVVDVATGQMVLRNTNVLGTSLTATAGLTPGKSYTWYLGVVNGAGVTTFNGGLTFTLPALTAPLLGAPTGTVPASSGYDKPNFGWSPSPGAHHYHLYVVDTTTNTVALNLPNIGNVTNFTPTDAQALIPGRNYAFYVGAISTNGMASAFQSMPRTFNLAPLAPPTHTAPGENIAAAAGYDRQTFQWSPVPGAHHYYLYVQDVLTGAAVVNLPNVPNAFHTLTEAQALTPGRAYRWYVAASNSSGTFNAFSSARNLTLASLPAPVPTGPNNGSVLGAGNGFDRPPFLWNASAGADSYYLYVVDSASGAVVINAPNIEALNYVPTEAQALTPGRSYTWYVGAVSTNGQASTFTGPRTFTLGSLSAPTQIAPAAGQNFPANSNYDRVAFNWSSVAGAHHYYLFVVDNATNMAVVNLPNATTTNSYMLTEAQALTPGKSYTWYVGAASTDGKFTAFSGGRTFTLGTFAAPTQTGPANGAVLVTDANYDKPTFTWNAVNGAHHYYLYVQNTTTGAVAVNLPNVAGTSYTLTDAQALTPGHNYIWYVAASSTNGAVNVFQSAARTFSLANLTAPTQNNPAVGANIAAGPGYDRVAFTWNMVPGAHHYYLYVIDTATNAVVVNLPNVVSTTHQLSEAEALNPGRTYTWYVGAVSTNGTGVFSSGRTFSLAALGTPVQTGPAAGANIAAAAGYDKPTFTWNAVPGAHHYYLYAIDDANAVVVNVPNVVGTSYTLTDPQALTPGKTYRWYVGAVSSNGKVFAFQPTPRSFTLAPLAAPVQTFPTTISPPVPTFTWNASPGAHHYYLYVVDLSTNQAVIDMPNIGTGTSQISPVALVPGRNYTWYLLAISTNGHRAYLTTGRTFTVS